MTTSAFVSSSISPCDALYRCGSTPGPINDFTSAKSVQMFVAMSATILVVAKTKGLSFAGSSLVVEVQPTINRKRTASINGRFFMRKQR